METWTEMEAKLEPQLRAWAKELDQIEAEEAAAEAELDAKIKAAEADTHAKHQAQQAKMHADFEARRAKLQQDMDALNDKIDAAVVRLDADIAKAVGKAKADLEAHRAQMRAGLEKVNAQLKAIYESEVNHIKGQIARMQTWAQTTDAKVRARINADLEALRKQATDLEQRIQKLHTEQVATWNENQAKVEHAIADLKEGREKALADLKEGREKAAAEFKAPV